MNFATILPLLQGVLQGAQTKSQIDAQRAQEQRQYEMALAEARSRAEAYTLSAEATSKAATRLIEATGEALEDDYFAISVTERQIQKEGALDTERRVRQGIRERAIMRNALASSGIQGGTTGVRDRVASRLQQAMDIGIISEDTQSKMQDQAFRKKQAKAQAQERYNVAQGMLDESEARRAQATSVVYPTLDQGPAWLDTASVVMSAMSGYFQGKAVTSKYTSSRTKVETKNAKSQK